MKLSVFNIRDFTCESAAAAFSMLDAQKKKRLGAMRDRDGAMRSLAADMLARRGAAAFCGCKPSEVELAVDKNGKPFVANREVCISLSHSRDYAVCAVSASDVGVDIELIRDFSRATARRVCTGGELDYIFSAEADVNVRFFKIWTLKEAYAKCVGVPLMRCVNDVSFGFDGKKVSCSISGFSLETDTTHDGYVVSVCERA